MAVKNGNFTPKNFSGELGCYPNSREGIDNKIACEKFIKIGPVKLSLHAGEVLKLYRGRANWTSRHFEPHAKFDRN